MSKLDCCYCIDQRIVESVYGLAKLKTHSCDPDSGYWHRGRSLGNQDLVERSHLLNGKVKDRIERSQSKFRRCIHEFTRSAFTIEYVRQVYHFIRVKGRVSSRDKLWILHDRFRSNIIGVDLLFFASPSDCKITCYLITTSAE